MTSNADTPKQGSASEPSGPKTNTKAFSVFNSPSIKLILIGFVTIMLLIPSAFVLELVHERMNRAGEAARDIAQSWGGTQEVNGPYLVVPFTETVVKGTGDRQETRVHQRTALIFPQKQKVSGDIAVEERQKSIYSLPVYHSRLELTGQFSPPPAGAFEPHLGGSIDISADKAVVVMGIGDVRALKSEVALNGERSQCDSLRARTWFALEEFIRQHVSAQ